MMSSGFHGSICGAALPSSAAAAARDGCAALQQKAAKHRLVRDFQVIRIGILD
jgi:hypothetical protein